MIIVDNDPDNKYMCCGYFGIIVHGVDRTRNPIPKPFQYGINSVWQCPECATRWVVRDDLDCDKVWVKLRWYHFDAKRQLEGR